MKHESSSSGAMNTKKRRKKTTLNQERGFGLSMTGVSKRGKFSRGSCSSLPTLNTFCITDQFSSILFCTGAVFVRFSEQDLPLSRGQIEHTQPSTLYRRPFFVCVGTGQESRGGIFVEKLTPLFFSSSWLTGELTNIVNKNNDNFHVSRCLHDTTLIQPEMFWLYLHIIIKRWFLGHIHIKGIF